MAKRTYINVQQKHIESGEPGDGENCPIALVFRELFPKATSIDVEADYALIGFDLYNEGKRFKLPKKAQNFIEIFDNGDPVEPFAFWTL